MEIFAELVRSGVVRPEDEIFDALMGVWMPADQHPIVALFQDPLVVHPNAGPLPKPAGEEQATEPAAEVAAPAGGDASTEPAGEVVEEIQLDLVSPQQKSPEEAQKAFIEKMEEERRQELDVPDQPSDLPLVTAQSDVVGRSGTFRAGLEPGAPTARPRPVPPKRKTTPVRRSPLGMTALFGVLLVAVIVSTRVARPELGTGETPTEEATGDASARAPRAVTRTEEQIREDAYRGFVDGMESLQQELVPGPVPRAWLEGAYLADPEAYPEVRPYWERYMAFADAAEAREAALYRQAYLRAAAQAGVSGPVRSLRMATALEDFSSSRTGRTEHYARVRELAASALALHDLMVKLKGRISYEPIRGPRVSADPVIEAAGTDPEAQELLEAALDRLLQALHGADGTSARDRLKIPDWLVEGLRSMPPAG